VSWRVAPSSEPGLRSAVQAILREFNAPAGVTGPADAEPLNLEASDTNGSRIGGLVGETYWSWLVIDVLAVDPVFRGRGVGTELVQHAEAMAADRGCMRAHTTAWAFQGLGFWQKLGYAIVGELADHPDGHVLYWLRRDFT
jgi:GNAT superfamily N-acetyltransferase